MMFLAIIYFVHHDFVSTHDLGDINHLILLEREETLHHGYVS